MIIAWGVFQSGVANHAELNLERLGAISILIHLPMLRVGKLAHMKMKADHIGRYMMKEFISFLLTITPCFPSQTIQVGMLTPMNAHELVDSFK
jgi:hypothetical protein